MKKFFLFKRKDVDTSSTTASDNGEGLDILAVAVDQLAFMTASLGKVNIVFNDATIYEESNLLDGESFKKTSVSVACEQGGEAALIDSIMAFISSDKVKTSVMRFDAVEGKTNVKEASIQSLSDVVSEVKQLPIVRSTQAVSTNTFIGGTSGTAFGTGNIIGGIDFGEGNKPAVDYIEDNLQGTFPALTGWTNAGSEGNTYDITTVNGTVTQVGKGRTGGGLSTTSAKFSSSGNLELPSNYIAEGDFTLFAVFGKSESDIDENGKLGFMFQGSASSGQGLTLGFVDAFENNAYQIKFSNEKGGFVEAITTDPIIDTHLPKDVRRTAYVFIMRRDTDNRLHFYNNSGNLIAGAESNTSGESGRTDRNLVLRYLGNGTGEKFLGNVARFGIIPRDIGTAAASKLAIDLDKKYTPLS